MINSSRIQLLSKQLFLKQSLYKTSILSSCIASRETDGNEWIAMTLSLYFQHFRDPLCDISLNSFSFIASLCLSALPTSNFVETFNKNSQPGR